MHDCELRLVLCIDVNICQAIVIDIDLGRCIGIDTGIGIDIDIGIGIDIGIDISIGIDTVIDAGDCHDDALRHKDTERQTGTEGHRATYGTSVGLSKKAYFRLPLAYLFIHGRAFLTMVP